MHQRPLHLWSDALQAVIDANCEIFRRAFVLGETSSTQDAAVRLAAGPGEVVTTGRQTAGRGRLGRPWADTAEHGIAVTGVLTHENAERLSLTTAVAVAETAETLTGRPVGIKWPNDIVADGRKLAGILLEQRGEACLIGVGINVHHHNWPADLASKALSLRDLGATTDRLGVQETRLPVWDNALRQATEHHERA